MGTPAGSPHQAPIHTVTNFQVTPSDKDYRLRSSIAKRESHSWVTVMNAFETSPMTELSTAMTSFSCPPYLVVHNCM